MYTSILGASIEKQEALYGKKITIADRDIVETAADTIIAPAKDGNVAFLVVREHTRALSANSRRLAGAHPAHSSVHTHTIATHVARPDTNVRLLLAGASLACRWAIRSARRHTRT